MLKIVDHVKVANITKQNTVNEEWIMDWKTKSIENILEYSESEKWCIEEKHRYLKKISYRNNLLRLFLKTRIDFVDILTCYVKNKIDDLNYIHSVLEEKWKKN